MTGKTAAEAFKNEPGGHRVQRIPPTERSGRVHTSTITVCVLPEPTETQIKLDDQDLEWQFCRGSGAGGQNRNKRSTAVQLTYKPTGLMVRCESERAQDANRRGALSILRAKLWEAKNSANAATRAFDRKSQIGSGQRADKIRTIRYQDGVVTDHRLNKRWNLKDYLRGNF